MNPRCWTPGPQGKFPNRIQTGCIRFGHCSSKSLLSSICWRSVDQFDPTSVASESRRQHLKIKKIRYRMLPYLSKSTDTEFCYLLTVIKCFCSSRQCLQIVLPILFLRIISTCAKPYSSGSTTGFLFYCTVLYCTVLYYLMVSTIAVFYFTIHNNSFS